MNDTEIVIAVKESFTNVVSTTPLEQIVGRSRAVRSRRRIMGLTGALGLAAAAAIAVSGLVAVSHQPGRPVNARFAAAWTVAKHADGTIHVTIRQLADPAGLQSQLRADGVPASVTFGHLNPACQDYPRTDLVDSVISSYRGDGPDIVLVIHPSALPSDAGVQIANLPVTATGQSQAGAFVGFEYGLVQASQQCTGS